ncbi:hypothetical protein K501DRAFT_11226 [Backusella circina FSU 941]|nr:hypothetical protein K501DRAFT_11226 [Backusella circina FSU 941]
MKSDDIWSQNLLINDKEVLLDDLPPSEPDMVPQANNDTDIRHDERRISISSLDKRDTIIDCKPLTKTSLSTANNHTSRNEPIQEAKADDIFLSSIPEETPSTSDAVTENKKAETPSSSNARPHRNKGKRKWVDDEQETMSIMTSSNILEQPVTDKKKRSKNQKSIQKDESLDETNIPTNTTPPVASTSGRKRKNQDTSLPSPNTINGKRRIEKEDDWSDSEIDDDLEFLSHFDEPF